MATTDPNDIQLKKMVIDALNTGTVTNISTSADTDQNQLSTLNGQNYTIPGRVTNTTNITVAGDTTTGTVIDTLPTNQDYFYYDTAGIGTQDYTGITFHNNNVSFGPPLFSLAEDNAGVLVTEPIIGTMCFIKNGSWDTKEGEKFSVMGYNLTRYKLESNEIIACFNEAAVTVAFGNRINKISLQTLIGLLTQYDSKALTLVVPKVKTERYEKDIVIIKENITKHLGVQVYES